LAGRQAGRVAHRALGPVGIATAQRSQTADLRHGVVDRLAAHGVAFLRAALARFLAAAVRPTAVGPDAIRFAAIRLAAARLIAVRLAAVDLTAARLVAACSRRGLVRRAAVGSRLALRLWPGLRSRRHRPAHLYRR